MQFSPIFNDYAKITTTVEDNGYAGIFIIPREAFDIDYDTSVPPEVTDEYNTVNNLAYTFEQILDNQIDYTLEKKTVFRNDASMFHQV